MLVLDDWMTPSLQAASLDSATAPIINREPLRLRGRRQQQGGGKGEAPKASQG